MHRIVLALIKIFLLRQRWDEKIAPLGHAFSPLNVEVDREEKEKKKKNTRKTKLKKT